jgi:hypothetical protein
MKDKREHIPLAPYNGAGGLNCPPNRRETAGVGGYKEIPEEAVGYCHIL